MAKVIPPPRYPISRHHSLPVPSLSVLSLSNLPWLRLADKSENLPATIIQLENCAAFFFLLHRLIK